MSIQSQIEEITTNSINYELKKAFNAGFILGKFSSEIETFLAKFPEASLSVSDGNLRLRCKSREEALHFIMVFGGQWKKELETWYPDKIEYSRKVEFFDHEFELIASEAPPPPSCQIVEEEVEVPASKKMVKRIVCSKESVDDVPVSEVVKGGEVVVK